MEKHLDIESTVIHFNLTSPLCILCTLYIERIPEQINGIMVRVTEKYSLIKLVSMQISVHRKYLLK